MARRSQNPPRSKSLGFRLDLGDEIEAKLNDFCAAYYRGNKSEILREAADWYIDKILEAEPERKKRYDAARQKRLLSEDQPIVATTEKSGIDSNGRSPRGRTSRTDRRGST
jgi:hypothetical protein